MLEDPILAGAVVYLLGILKRLLTVIKLYSATHYVRRGQSLLLVSGDCSGFNHYLEKDKLEGPYLIVSSDVLSHTEWGVLSSESLLYTINFL